MTHVAPALVTLFRQVDAKFPNRSKASDGTLGDAAHRARKSDHNPDADGSVNAGDFTHDPNGGLDCRQFSRELAESGDNRIRYVIFNRRIWQPVIGWSGYGGDNPHDKHCHLSIVHDSRENNAKPWALPMLTGSAAPAPSPLPTAKPPTDTPPRYIAPQEDDVKVYALIYPNRTEHWLLYSDGWRTNLSGNPDDIGAMQRTFPTITVSGEGDCNRWKNFTSERSYAQLKQRPLT